VLTAPIIDSALEELEALAPLLSAEVPQSVSIPTSLSPQARAYKEALMTTRVLAEKLRVLRTYCLTYPTGRRPCSTCDGD
jgi:hypothetical protein